MRQLYINIKPALRAFELTSKTVFGTQLLGNYRSLFKGKGLEFEEYEKYTPTDDAKLIDWKASIRANTLLVREYVEERSMNIFFLVGTNNSMIYTSTNKLKAEYAGELVISLAHIMMKEKDLVGFALFNKKVEKLALPACSTTQLYTLIQAISDKKYYGGVCNLKSALSFAFNTLKPKTTLFIVSDFISLTEGWEDELKKASSKFEIAAIIIRDPVDFALPAAGSEEVVLRDPYSNKVIDVRIKAIRERYKEYVSKHLEHLKRTFYERNVDFLVLPTDKPFVSPILNFFVMRRHKKWK